MAADNSMEYIREHITEDIGNIRRQHYVDVSPEIGKILYGFVSYNKNKPCRNFSKFAEFIEIISGLERYVKGKIKEPVSLHETKKSGWIILEILKGRDKRALSELEKFSLGLKNMDLVLNGHRQLPL